MKVFAVKFNCPNCHNQWWIEFEKGDQVTSESEGVHCKSVKCVGNLFCKVCFYVFCPVCDNKGVVAKERKPIIVVTREKQSKILTPKLLPGELLY